MEEKIKEINSYLESWLNSSAYSFIRHNKEGLVEYYVAVGCCANQDQVYFCFDSSRSKEEELDALKREIFKKEAYFQSFGD